MFEGTTIIGIRGDKEVVIAGDGQVSMGNTIMKGSATKVRRIAEGKVVVGFAGSTADAMTLFEKLEGKLSAFGGNLTRAAVELAKDWRSDKYLRRLEALMIAADKHSLLLISGTGDVLSPDEGIVAIGSGGNYALAAAKALSRNTKLNPETVARQALQVAAEICVFTNDQLTVEAIQLD